MMATPRRPGRPKSQLPACYYEGFLEKRSFKDKVGRKLWASLCGNSLFFFNNSKDNDYVEKLDLSWSDFVSLTDDPSHDRNLDAARMLLRFKNKDIQLTAPSLETRELWKGFIFSVVELTVPSSLNLLPGQIHMLREVVEKEKLRRKPIQSPPAPAPVLPTVTVATPITPGGFYTTVLSEMPVCYQQVSRAAAELILESNQEKGNLLLRPGRDGSCFAVSTRQDLNGSVFRHYKVSRRHEGGFAIAIENPIPCETLHEVISCLVEMTGGTLKPLVLEEAYEESITFVDNNRESGEKMIMPARSSSGPPVPVGPKPSTPPLPVGPKPVLTGRADSTAAQSEGYSEYLIPFEEDDFDDVPPTVEPRVPGRALLPPSHPLPSNRPRTMSTSATSARTNQPLPPLPGANILSQSLSQELKEKLRNIRQRVSE
ncbi:signal-transducing adaptor protein 2b [Salminus brasiliensis]|uniref:signal-transducing adaptor protein 2b n=1 Tax=Salminus brasiliensis TaxID=930266 RepID=UPI003B832A36